MILRPLEPPISSSGGVVAAWDAVARNQQTPARRYALIRQPEHARLAGELARHVAIDGMPAISEEILQGISLHDEGWAHFDSGREKLQATPAEYSDDNVPVNAEGKPLSFQDIKPGDFLRAWRDSIAAAEAAAAVAGLIVSGHFYRLGQYGIEAKRYSPPEMQLVREFLREEEERRQRLSKQQTRTPAEVEYWTDILQFCDLLSLYLCCGAEDTVEFPQRIAKNGETIHLRAENDTIQLSPALMAHETVFTKRARVFPGGGSVDLRWIVR